MDVLSLGAATNMRFLDCRGLNRLAVVENGGPFVNRAAADGEQRFSAAC